MELALHQQIVGEAKRSKQAFTVFFEQERQCETLRQSKLIHLRGARTQMPDGTPRLTSLYALPVQVIKTFGLLLPALLPSWRFFDWIAPSPRIEFTLIDPHGAEEEQWQEFRPRPKHVPVATMLRRLLWNPGWNEALFLVSCAERQLERDNTHAIEEIRKRIGRSLLREPASTAPGVQMKFRLVFVRWDGEALERVVTYVSAPDELRTAGHEL